MFSTPEGKSIFDHDCLTNFAGMYQHPFSRKVREAGPYTIDWGPWTVEGLNGPREKADDPDEVTFVLVRFCPFCGQPVYPPKAVPSDKPEEEVTQQEEGDHGEEGSVRTSAAKSRNRSK